MNTIDTDQLVTDIENAVMDNGIVLEVESVTPKEVKDNVKNLDTFRVLYRNTDLINGDRCWIQLAYGDVFAYVGVRQEDGRIEALVDVSEECMVDDLDQIIAAGIRHYAHRAGVDDVD